MTASVHGKDVLAATITEAISGAWSAELELDSEEAISGRVTLDVDGVAWLGTVMRGELESGRFHAQIVGGNGALGKELPAKHYLRASTGLHLTEAAAAGGEKISKDTDAAVLGRATTRYSRRRTTIGTSIAQIARESSASWRVLRDGTLWLGADRWPVAPGATLYDELSRSPGQLTVAVESPVLQVGTTLKDSTGDGTGAARKIVNVVTRVTASDVTQELTFADDDDASASGQSRMRRMFGGIVEALFGHRMDFGAWYPSLVVSQDLGDGSVDLYPDDPLMRGQGISKVPLRHGLPGCSVKVKPGSRIMLFFEDCDPSKPAAGLWPDGSSVLSIEVSADLELTLKAALVNIEAAAVNVQGNLTVTGGITGGAIVGTTVAAGPFTIAALGTHVHVIAPGTSSGPPIPGGGV